MSEIEIYLEKTDPSDKDTKVVESNLIYQGPAKTSIVRLDCGNWLRMNLQPIEYLGVPRMTVDGEILVRDGNSSGQWPIAIDDSQKGLCPISLNERIRTVLKNLH